MDIGKWYTYNGKPSSSTSSHKAGIDVMVVSQNQINNTSLVRVRPWGVKLSSSTYNLSQQTLTVKVNNSSRTSKTSYDFREATTDKKFYLTSGYPFKRHSGSGSLVSGAYVYDFTITHNDDGTKTIPIYALIPFYNSASGRNWTVDIDIDLPSIPRANTVVISKTYIDDPINIAINKTDDSFTTTLIYNAINADGTVTTEEIANKTANKNISYTISTKKLTTILSKNKTSTSVLGILYAYTYSGNTQIGQKSYDLTLNIEETPPIVSATVVDTNSTTIALTGDSSKIVKYISKPKVTITAQAQQQADISSYSTVWGNSSSTAQETTFNSGIDSNIVTVSAKDSRNWVGEKEYDLNALGKYIEYIKPNFSKFTLSRPETTSNTINADLTGVWFNSSFGATSNTLEFKYRYKEKGGEYGDYQTITLTTNENNFSFNGSLGSSFNYQKQYDFEFVLTDKLMSVITTFNVESGESIIRIAETYMRILGDIKVKGNVTINDELVNKQIGDIVITSTNKNPSSRLGGTWELIDKEFIDLVTSSTDSTYFSSSSSITFDNIYIMRTKHNLKLRLGFTTKVELSDSTVSIGTLNYNNLGIDNLAFSLYNLVGATDGGNGLIQMQINYSTGELTSVDVIPKGTATTISSGAYCYLLIDILLTNELILDESCDKFFWKKTA